MKKYQKLLSITCLSFIPLNANATNINEGEYKIFCHTKNGGKRYLEAFPKDNVVRPRPESLGQDQDWFIKDAGNGYYRIGCHTQNGGKRYLEAFPKDDKIRPRPQSWSQDQNWFIKDAGNGYYRIGCHTKNGGTRFLEAFPKDNVARPRVKSHNPITQSFNQDQVWQLDPIN